MNLATIVNALNPRAGAVFGKVLPNALSDFFDIFIDGAPIKTPDLNQAFMGRYRNQG